MLMKEEVTHAILFLDINMPVMDGWLSLDEIEKFDPHLKNKLRIVMVSASEYPKDLERMQAHPLVDTHMPKPLEAEKIRAYVNELVSN
jgi:CheY-like chemotaxis protein